MILKAIIFYIFVITAWIWFGVEMTDYIKTDNSEKPPVFAPSVKLVCFIYGGFIILFIINKIF